MVRHVECDSLLIYVIDCAVLSISHRHDAVTPEKKTLLSLLVAAQTVSPPSKGVAANGDGRVDGQVFVGNETKESAGVQQQRSSDKAT